MTESLSANKLTRIDYTHLVIVLALAVATRFYKLGYASLWYDEAHTIRLSSAPMSTLWITASDPTPPLFYTIIHFLLDFGHSEFLLRLPSAVFGVLTIAVIYLATRKIGGSRAAFAASILLALSFRNIEYSQEARAYALLGFCLSVSFLGLTNLALRWRSSSLGFTFPEFLRSGGGVYALGLIGALYSHNTAVFYWLGVQFFFLAWWIRPFRFSFLCLASWFATNFVVLLLWIPWFLASLDIMDSGVFSWLQQVGPLRALITLESVHGIRFMGQAYVDLLLAILGLIGLYSLRRSYAIVVLFIALLVLSSLVIWAYGFIATPVYMTRTILWGSLFSAVLIGIGVGTLPARIAYAVTLLIFLGGASVVHNYFEKNRAMNENWRDATAIFNEKQGPNDILIFHNPTSSWPFFYYVEDYSSGWKILGKKKCSKEIALTGQIDRSGPILEVNWTKSDLGTRNRIPRKPGANLWIVESHCPPQNWTQADELFFPNWSLQQSYRSKNVNVHHLVQAGQK